MKTLFTLGIIISMAFALGACSSETPPPKTENTQKIVTKQTQGKAQSTTTDPGAAARCQKVCTKSPRLHFEWTLAKRLKALPPKERDATKKKAEKEWTSRTQQAAREIKGCVIACSKRSRPEELSCLEKASTFPAVQNCFMKFRKPPARRRKTVKRLAPTGPLKPSISPALKRQAQPMPPSQPAPPKKANK